MKKKRYFILTLMLSLLCIDKTYAACTQEEIKEFKNVEDEYKITYEFNKDTKDYTVTFETPAEKKYDFVIYTDIKLNCKKITDEKTECYNIPANEYNLGIIGNTTTCDEKIKSITLKLSRYNNYSEDPLCEGIEEFVLCQPTYDKEIDYETFQSRVKTYINTKSKEEIETEKHEDNKVNELIEYIKDNLFQTLIIIIFIILVIITTITSIKSIRKSRRLE